MATHEILHYVLTSYKWRFNEAAIFWFLRHFAKKELRDWETDIFKSFYSKSSNQLVFFQKIFSYIVTKISSFLWRMIYNIYLFNLLNVSCNLLLRLPWIVSQTDFLAQTEIRKVTAWCTLGNLVGNNWFWNIDEGDRCKSTMVGAWSN